MNIFTGVVEDRINDPLKLGRCKVRVFGVHDPDTNILKTDDLPWATIMQPVTSSGVSGLGHSPTAFVEGTWVLITFADEEKQYPIILGTFAGVPQSKKGEISQSSVVAELVTPPKGEAADKKEEETKAEEAKADNLILAKPQSMTLSGDGFALLKKEEGLASLTQGGRSIGSDRTPDATLIYAYTDTKRLWTIGWGSRYMPNGQMVTGQSVITKAQADGLLRDRLEKEFEAGIKRRCKVMLTQSMYDAVVSMTYNMGVGGFFSSEIGTSLNSGRYKEAAAFIPTTKTNNGTLSARRRREMDHFLRDGIPNVSTGVLEKAVPDPVAPETIAAPSRPLNKTSNSAFTDPAGRFPSYFNEPDTNRLARGESISKTIVYAKEAARATGVKIARKKNQKSSGAWDQPPIPYSQKYPHNQVFATEGGHIKEYDNTPDRERIHEYHKSGTFTEIDANGTTVNRIVGDSYEILERNGFVVIRGKMNVTIQGSSNVRIENDSNIEILGNANVATTGDTTHTVGGTYSLKIGGEFHVDASKIYLNSGKTSALSVPTEKAAGEPTFSTLQIINRSADIDANYEMPEEGSNTDFVVKSIKNGNQDDPAVFVPAKENPDEVVKDEETAVQKQPEKTSDVCGLDISGATVFTPGFQLTDNTTLGRACAGESGIPSGTNYGMTASQIVCNLKQLFVNCVEPINRRYPNMSLNSTWRSEIVNRKCGGQTKSDHLKGMAADIKLNGFTRKQYYEAAIEIAKFLPAYKQIILEYKNGSTWIHVSFDSKNNSMECLTINAAINETIKSGGFLFRET